MDNKEKDTNMKQDEVTVNDQAEATQEDNVENAEEQDTQFESESVEDQITSELKQLKVEIEELEDKNLRLQAELVNMRQRNQKEREDAAKYRSQDLAKALLPAIDNLERALEVEANDGNAEALKKGVEMVLDNLKQTLVSHGVEVITAQGETFDPNIHQAVQTVPSDDEHPTDIVVQELQKGYKLYDRVLRPAMVIVAQ